MEYKNPAVNAKPIGDEEELLKFFKSVKTEEPVGKIYVSGINGFYGYAYEYKQYPGIYFYPSADGNKIFRIKLNVVEITNPSTVDPRSIPREDLLDEIQFLRNVVNLKKEN